MNIFVLSYEREMQTIAAKLQPLKSSEMGRSHVVGNERRR
jgi:hypothetical protein